MLMSTSTRITVAQYDEMIAQGQFEPREEHHVELIEGEIIPMSPIGNDHEIALDTLAEWSIREGPIDQIRVRVQNSLGISGLNSVPQPDLTWVRRRSYARGRPEAVDVFLLIEVADTSLSKDRGSKARLYARAGIADYWVVNIVGRTVEVRRDPEEGNYQSIQIFGPGDMIPLLAFPDIAFPVEILFPSDTD
jgi:Uma2 family endonuclease